jgi:hypothetical protein
MSYQPEIPMSCHPAFQPEFYLLLRCKAVSWGGGSSGGAPSAVWLLSGVCGKPCVGWKGVGRWVGLRLYGAAAKAEAIDGASRAAVRRLRRQTRNRAATRVQRDGRCFGRAHRSTRPQL